jgi:hypothetical protein
MTAGTVESVEIVEEVDLDPGIVNLLLVIDHALAECATGRSLVSSDEIANFLLDIRVAALALRR